MEGKSLNTFFKQKRPRPENLEKLKNLSPSQPVVKRVMTRRFANLLDNLDEPQPFVCNRGVEPQPKGIGIRLITVFFHILQFLASPKRVGLDFFPVCIFYFVTKLVTVIVLLVTFCLNNLNL